MSSMLRKGKQLCWKHIKDNERFLDLFSSSGTEVHLDYDQLCGLERLGAQYLERKGLTR